MNEAPGSPISLPKKSSLGKLIGIILAVLILIVVGLYFLGKNRSRSTGEDVRKNADEIFLLSATQNSTSPAAPNKEAQQIIEQAWNKFYEGDYDSSVANFKRAYNLDNKSPNPNIPEFYLSLGIILGKRSEYDGSIKILAKGVEVNPRHTRTICTLAYSYVNKYLDNPTQNLAYLDTSLNYFKQADSINPNDVNCQYFWSFAEFYKGNYAESWKHVIKIEKLGATMDANFLQDLSKKMQRPQ